MQRGNQRIRWLLRLSAAALALAALLVAFAPAGAAVRRAPVRVAAAPGRQPSGSAANPRHNIGVLQTTIMPDPALVHDGDGVASVALADVDSANVVVRRVKATVRLPAPARATAVQRAQGWRCRIERGAHNVSCVLLRGATSASSLPPIELGVRSAGESFGPARLQAHAAWLQPAVDGRLRPQFSSAGLLVHERAPLSVTVRSTEKTVLGPSNGLPTVPTILQGTVGRRTPEPIGFQWRQLCGRGPCPRVRWASATKGLVIDGQQPGASFIPPDVDRPQVLRFELTASDPRGAVTAVTAVRVVPDQIEHIDPRLTGAALARASLHSNPRPLTTLPLTKADQATVGVGAPGAYRTAVNGLVRLDARVRGQHVSEANWAVALGPRSMLVGARRSGSAIRFRAPDVSGTYAVRMTAKTAAGSFSRDELLEVNPVVSVERARAAIASTGSEREQAFCAEVSAAREQGRISISLPAGGTFTAETNRPPGDQCLGTERIDVTGGSIALGSFELERVDGTITISRGLVIAGGTLMTPGFWSATPESAAAANVHAIHGALDAHAAAAGAGLAIPFRVPTSSAVTVGLEIPLTDSGFGDLTGGISVDHNALASFPLSRSLPESANRDNPHAWKMTQITLSVVPAARRFELTADAKGPSSIGGEVNFEGVLTFDGQVSASVTVSNLAVFQSADGEKVPHTVQGTVTLEPGRRLDPADPSAAGAYFPVIDVEVSAQFENYRPASDVSLSGRVSWSSNGPLEVEGTLNTEMKGTPVRFTVTGSFTDADNWTLYSQFLGGDRGLAIGTNPELFRLKLLEGTLSRHGGKLKISVKGEATDIRLSGLASVPSAKIEFTTDCTFQRETTGTRDGVCLLVELQSELTLPDRPSLKVSGAVKVDFSTGLFEASGHVTLNRDDPMVKTIGLHDAQLFLTNAGPPENAVCKSVVRAAAAGGLYYGLTAEGEALGLKLHLSGAYLGDKDFCLTATVGSAALPSGNSDNLTQVGTRPKAGEPPPVPSCTAENATTLQDLTFAYSSDTGEGQFSGKFCFPSAVRKELGAAGTGVGSVDLFLSKSGGFTGDASYDLGRTLWFLNATNADTPDPTKAALGFRKLTVSVKANKTVGLSLGFNAGGEVSLPAPTNATGGSGHASRAPVSLGVEIALNPTPKLTVEGNVGQSTGDAPCNPSLNPTQVAIRNAFGADGFDICHFGFNGSIALSGFSLGVNAAFKLPTTWGPELGVHNASLKIGFNISAQTPCLNLEIAKSDPHGPAAVDLLNKGAIVANAAALRVAPRGCSLPGGTQLQPGISLKFDGTMFGTATSVDLAITRKDPGLKIDFTQRTGASSLGPLKFGATNIRVLLDAPETQLELHTSMTIGQAGGVVIDGNFKHSGTSTTLDASACLISALPREGETPQCGPVSLVGAEFAGTVKLHFETGSGATAAKFSGRLTADLRVVKTDVNVRELTYDSTQGGLQALDFATQATLALGPASATGAVEVVYARAPGTLKLSLNGSWSLWGMTRGSINRAWDLSRIEIPFTIVPPGVPLKLAFGLIRLSGDAKGALVWTPGGGFSVTTDFKALRLELCDPFDVLGCTRVGELRVNRDTGEVNGEVFGLRYGVPARDWVGGASRAQLPQVNNEGMIVSGRWRKCIDLKEVNARRGDPVKIVDCPEGSRTESLPREWQLIQRWTLEPGGLIRDYGHLVCLTANVTRVIAYQCGSARDQQRWQIDYRGRLVGSDGKCIEVPGDTGADSTSLAFAPCSAQPSQGWAMSGALQLSGSGLCASGRGGQRAAFTPLVLVHCDNSTSNWTFKTNPDGRLHVSDTDCVTNQLVKSVVLGLNQNDAIIRTCEWGTLESAPTMEFKDGDVKQAGRDECLVATNRAVGARLEFASCATAASRRQWNFGRVLAP